MRRLAVVWLVIAGLILSACGAAILPQAESGAESGKALTIGLPRIVITVDEAGKLGIEGFLSLSQLDQLANSLGLPLGLSSYQLPPELVKRMMIGGIQHLEIRQTADKLVLLFNGEPMPSLSWKDGSVDSLGQLLSLFGPQASQTGEMIQKIVPLAERLGLSVALKFPTEPGAESIPYATDEVVSAQPEPVTTNPSLSLNLEVTYDEAGVPSFLGIPPEQIQALFGGQQLRLALDPKIIERAQANNIQHVELRSKGDGLWLYVNNNAVPPVRWDKQTLGSAIDVWVAMNPGLNPSVAKTIRTLAPYLSNADLSIMLNFPVAPGAEPIPVTAQ
jgi:hypothetical protein